MRISTADQTELVRIYAELGFHLEPVFESRTGILKFQHLRLFDFSEIQVAFVPTLEICKFIKLAVTKVLSATWQRCRVHFMRNALAHAGRSGRRVVSAFIATAFAQDDVETAKAQWRRVADQLRPKVPKLATLMDEAEADVLAYMTFPAAHRTKLHSTDEMDKPFVSRRAIFRLRGRPRGEERGVGWKLRQAA